MDIKKAIKILETHNKWRRGNDDNIKMKDPKTLGIAIDCIIKYYKKTK